MHVFATGAPASSTHTHTQTLLGWTPTNATLLDAAGTP